MYRTQQLRLPMRRPRPLAQRLRRGMATVRDRAGVLRGRKAGRVARWTRADTYLWLGVAALAFAGLLSLVASRRRTARRTRRAPTVGDVMVRGVVTIHPSATLVAAAQVMRNANVGALPIVENGALRGLVTDRDLVVRALARGVDPEATPVRYFESDEVIAVRPDWDVEEALEVMRASHVGRLPVTDEDGRLVGIVTLGSLALRAPQAA
jgi:CBS domain-containing protein